VASALGLVLVTLLALVWVIPPVQGPTVECIDIDAVACDQAWRAMDASADGLEQWLPVTRAWVYDHGSPRSPCLDIRLEWGGGVFERTHDELC
jgi:hypothetical protein